ncbi:hypothetical protein TWF730_006182 [Orbilia blumenaviensis]|uniref:C2H2-type domain-containing protein n=1 Tax=Orbilia blumenaviensis TaxID=1796055 RepID=A0AAV9TVZ5_9PEZI
MSSPFSNDQDSVSILDPRETVMVDATRPSTPRIHIQTESPSGTGVPDVTLSPPGNKSFTGSQWMGSPPQVLHRGMPPPMWSNQAIETGATVIGPSVLSGTLPEGIRILQELKMNDSPSPTATQGSPMEQDDQEVFRFEGSTAGVRRSLPVRHPLITKGSPPKLFTSPTTYVPRNATQLPLTPPAHTSRGLPGSTPMVLSTSEPSRTPHNTASIRTARDQIETFECCCCQAGFTSQTSLVAHFTTAHKGRHTHPTGFKYNCRMCGDGFESRKDLDVHLLACGVVQRTKRSRNSSLSEQRFSASSHRYSTGSLSPVPHLGTDTPASGRESRLSLASLTSASELDLSDINSADDEQATIHKLLQKAKRQTINTTQAFKASGDDSEPISPTRRRKSSISARFAKNVAKNINKAVEAGLIKMEEFSEASENLAIPSGTSDSYKPRPSNDRAFPTTSSKGKSKKSKEQSPFLGMLACPFAKGDPEKYLTCLLIHRKDMPGLREHLGRVHFGGSTPDGAIRSRDWPTLFLYCFPRWNHQIPEGRFDYTETISTLQSLSLGEPITKFLRDLEKHLVSRRAKELQEMESIYHERSWSRYEGFLNRAQVFDQLPSSSSPQPISSPQPSPQASTHLEEPGYGYIQENRATVTLSVSRDIEFAINRQVDFSFAVGNFSAGEFRHWLDAMFDPPVSFADNHIIIHDYNVKIISLQDFEAFLNLELSTRQSHTRQHHAIFSKVQETRV